MSVCGGSFKKLFCRYWGNSIGMFIDDLDGLSYELENLFLALYINESYLKKIKKKMRDLDVIKIFFKISLTNCL